jgi:O-antigen/teichoic acid export membrane protein
MFEQIAFGYKVTKLSSLINVISAAIWLIVVFIIPLEKTSIQSIFSIYVLIMIIKSIVYGITDYSRIIQTGENCKISYIDILSNSSSYLWMRMIGTISTQFSVVLLDNKVGSEEVAYYSVGNKFTMPVGIMITTGVNAFFPYLTEFYHKNKNEYNRILSIVLAIVLTFGSLTAMLLSITSHIWLVTIMGEKYSGAVAAFNYQIWYTVCLVFDTVLSMIMSTSYKQKLLAVITTIDTLIYIPVLYYSVSFGASGMAIGKLIAAALSVSYHIVLMYFLLERKLKMQTLILTISYSVALFLTYLLVETMINQIIIVLMITIFLTIIPQSPIRQGLNLFYEIYNSKFKNFKC